MTPASPRTHWLARHILPHEPALRAWLLQRRVEGLEVDDIIQETYAVLSGLADVDHIERPKAYAFQTAHSVILRHLRRLRIVRIDTVGDMDLLSAAIDAPSPERQASSREELGKVIALIAGLPAKCREAFVLRKLEGFSQRDVARVMGISESTVEKHISRGLRVLMAAVKDIEPGRACEPRSFAAPDAQDSGPASLSRDAGRGRRAAGWQAVPT